MILGIFFIIKSNAHEGYIDCFSYIKSYIDKLNINKENIGIETFITDFEIDIISAFIYIINKIKEIHHIGYKFHYL